MKTISFKHDGKHYHQIWSDDLEITFKDNTYPVSRLMKCNIVVVFASKDRTLLDSFRENRYTETVEFLNRFNDRYVVSVDDLYKDSVGEELLIVANSGTPSYLCNMLYKIAEQWVTDHYGVEISEVFLSQLK